VLGDHQFIEHAQAIRLEFRRRHFSHGHTI
jgi:hypothetical protein